MRGIAEPETGTGARQRSKGHAGNAGVRACQSSDIRQERSGVSVTRAISPISKRGAEERSSVRSLEHAEAAAMRPLEHEAMWAPGRAKSKSDEEQS